MDSDDGSERGARSDAERPASSRQSSSKHVHTHDSRHKHSKPWTARLYRKHDLKHHNITADPADAEAAPLLRSEEPEETEDEAEQRPGVDTRGHRHSHSHAALDEGSRIFHGARDASRNCLNSLKDAAKKCGQAVADGTKKAAQGAKNAAQRVADGNKKAAQAVKNNPKRTMGAIIGALLATSIALGSDLIYDHKKYHHNRGELCTTPACVRAAESILQYLDPIEVDQDSDVAVRRTIDPCTDFDKFACGGFDKTHNLPAYMGDMSTCKFVLS
jgi:hypothetical protein